MPAGRWAVVFNAASGGSDDDIRDAVVDALRPIAELEIVTPETRETFAHEVRAAAERSDAVVSAGGDGTLNYTVNALGEVLSDVVLGLVPMGTGNDLARTVGLAEDPVEAARSLSDAGLLTLDVGRATGSEVDRLFINACMGGFPVDAVETIDADTKKRLGPLAFWVGGAKALADLTKSTVTVNGVTVEDCVAAGVGNGRTCGGGMEVWPSARPGDGVLDACVLAAPTVPKLIKLATAVKNSTHEEIDEVITLKDGRITIEADPGIEFNVDGELVGLHSPATFELVSQVRFLGPQTPTIRA
jgi:diacylglycerol kinase (ATP)